MPLENEPLENEWYELPDQEEPFCVVSVDEDEDIIEIQYSDGTLEEIDFRSWEEMSPEPAEAPGNWVGPYDDGMEDEEEYLHSGDKAEDEDWEEPYDE